MSKCISCGRELDGDDIGITRKLINRGAQDFYCVKCLSVRFGISEEDVRRLIENCRAAGCSLFF